MGVVLQGSEGVSEAVEVMVNYTLTREDWDSVQDIAHFAGRPEPASGITSKVRHSYNYTLFPQIDCTRTINFSVLIGMRTNQGRGLLV